MAYKLYLLFRIYLIVMPLTIMYCLYLYQYLFYTLTDPLGLIIIHTFNLTVIKVCLKMPLTGIEELSVFKMYFIIINNNIHLLGK